MGLAKTQTLLAALYTDGDLRDRFLASPEVVAGEFGVHPDQAIAVAKQCGADAVDFARSLHAKRRNEVRALLPRTVNALGEEGFRELFRGHAGRFMPLGTNKPRADALEFSRQVALAADSALFAVREAARSEAAWLEARSGKLRLSVRFFRFPPDSGGLTVAIWFRLHRYGPLQYRQMRINRSAF